MGESVTAVLAPRHHLLPENGRARMAKADLRKAEIDAWRVSVGHAVERARQLSGLSLKEFSARIQRDERQVARWIAGLERPQMDALMAVDALRQPVIVAFAELGRDTGVEIVTEIRVRRIGGER